MKLRKAIFPVAGMGTRFLPATKANPKEMLPVVDKPLIQYAVEEAIAAGITDLIFVTSYSKRAIEDHFDSSFELETRLKEQGKLEALKQIQNMLPKHVSCIYVRQAEPLGLGHAVGCAKHLVGDEPVAVLLADDLIDGHGKPCLKQMVEVYEETQASVVAVQPVPQKDISRYGVVDLKGESMSSGFSPIKGIIEKPAAEEAPSEYGVVGRYILQPEIFKHLDNAEKGSGDEIQLTDAIAKLIDQGVYAYQFDGIRYDCGSKLGYLKATVGYALQHEELASDFKTHLESIV